jgi:GxxExxY protein
MIKDSQLDETTEQRIRTTIDCGITVHRALGPGFVESAYRNAFCLELATRRIPFEREASVVVKYRNEPIALHRIDLVVYGSVIVELKAVSSIGPVHVAQVLSYLKATGLRVGLLMNFGGATLRDGLRRVVL